MTAALDDTPEVLSTTPESESTTDAAVKASETAKKPPAKKAPAKKAPAKKAPAKKAPAKKPAATVDKSASAQSATAKTAAAKKTTAAKATAAKAAATKATQAAESAEATSSKVAAAKSTATKTAAAKATAAKAAAAKTEATKVAAAKRAAAKVAKEAAAKETAEREAAEREIAEREAAEHDATAEKNRTPVLARAESDASLATEVAAPAVKETPAEEPATADEVAVEVEEVDTEQSVEVEETASDEAPVAEASVVDDISVTVGVPALEISNVSRSFGRVRAIDAISLTVPTGSFYGIVGPNGAGKTTTLSIVAGLLRADSGEVRVSGMPHTSRAAKRVVGVLPDRLRTFDRLTGRQLLYYYGLLRGLSADVVEKRTADLARAFDLTSALSRVVSDYSAGMTKKIMLAGALIHSPRLLVLDEPFESVDPVSSGIILDILRAYVDHGGTVILSSHGMDLVERVCSRIAVIVDGSVLAEGTVDEVRAGRSLEQRFTELAGGSAEVEGLEWLHTFSG